MEEYEKLAADVRDRINQLLKNRGLTQNSVASGNAPAQKRLNSQLSHGTAITLDTILRVLSACPDVSADWLLRGSVETSAASTSTNVNGNNNATGPNAAIYSQQPGVLTENFVTSLLAEKDRQIQTLLKLIGK